MNKFEKGDWVRFKELDNPSYLAEAMVKRYLDKKFEVYEVLPGDFYIIGHSVIDKETGQNLEDLVLQVKGYMLDYIN